MVNIGLIQMKAAPLNVQENLLKADHYISQTARDGAEIVVLPEMFNVGFSSDEKLMNLGERLDGYTVNWLKDQAETHNIYIITSIYEKFENYFYNTMVMIGKDRSLQIYRKRNPTCQERLVWKRYDKPGPGFSTRHSGGSAVPSALTPLPGKPMRGSGKAVLRLSLLLPYGAQFCRC